MLLMLLFKKVHLKNYYGAINKEEENILEGYKKHVIKGFLPK